MPADGSWIRLKYRPQSWVLEVETLHNWVRTVATSADPGMPDGAEALAIYLAQHAADWIQRTITYEARYVLTSGSVLIVSGAACVST